MTRAGVQDHVSALSVEKLSIEKNQRFATLDSFR